MARPATAPAAGIAPLREALADDVVERDAACDTGPTNVVVQPGGKPVIGKFLQAVMNPGDGVLFPTPAIPSTRARSSTTAGPSMPYRYEQTAPDSRSTSIISRRITPATKVPSSTTTCRTRSAARARPTRWRPLPTLAIAARPLGAQPTRPTSRCVTPARAARSRRCRA